jgi:metal-responsive CopG/Arc/MetJ family transcriptional regulator
VNSIRLPPKIISRIDAWAERKDCSRSDAIRWLIEDGLDRSRRSNATELAGKQLDCLADTSASSDEQGRRKKRLLKGPEEFREIIGKAKKAKQ